MTGDQPLTKQTGTVQKSWEDSILTDRFGAAFRYYRDGWKRVSLREYVPDFPLYLQLETTPRCNLRCRSCIQGYREIRQPYIAIERLMPIDLYRRIIDEAKQYGCPSISFHNNCEPLLDPLLEERIAIARKAGFLDIILVTNATLLNEERAYRILEAGLTKISFSIDACSSDTYRKNRVGGDFDVVQKNILRFLEQKEELGRDIPLTRVSFVVTNLNNQEKQEFERFWSGRVDAVEFQNFTPLLGYNEDLILPGWEPNREFQCSFPWKQVVIRANGDLLPCCSFYGHEVVIGNVHQKTIYNLWHSQKMKDLRYQLARGRFPYAPCRRCAGSNYAPRKEPNP